MSRQYNKVNRRKRREALEKRHRARARAAKTAAKA